MSTDTNHFIATLRNSWLGQHWRGELSLGISYWLVGFFANLALKGISSSFEAILSNSEPLSGLIGVAALWGCMSAIVTWHLVGVWRSASRHRSRGGTTFWAATAKVMVVVIVVITGRALIVSGGPQIKELYQMVDGDSPMGPFSMRLLNNGTEMEFAGGIPTGAAGKLEKFLDAAPTIKVVHLASPGGPMAEAAKIRDLIHQRKLITLVNADCLSACTVAYLGGVERYIDPTMGRLGFHQASVPGLDPEQARKFNEEQIKQAILREVKPDFIRKAYATANSSMWVPSRQELLASGYVTSLSQGQFATP